MWQLIKAEIKYNSDFIHFLVWGVILFFIIQYYYAVVLDVKAFLSALLLLQGGLGVPLVVGIRRSKEKRDRLLVLLPVSIRRIAIARLFISGFYLMVLLILAYVLNFCVSQLYPGTISSFTAHLSIAGITAIYTVVFYFLLVDLKGFINKNHTIFNIPVQGIYNFFKLLLVLAVIIFYFPVTAAIQNFNRDRSMDIYFGDLVRGMLKSGTWAIGLITFGLLLFVIAFFEFEKRKSYVE
jgi:hypothetical protein